ncbi:hypothetical protein M5D96_000677 [Drosophila gunungcola]|uniref:Uncharacterized protein n=1 Tax=Drosophila gunungcola TaxID=103775 RepID=A0A9P9YWR1_9MUSC|nr:hypothetical protein M5D96_000677 [Drosophila gunungcola]
MHVRAAGPSKKLARKNGLVVKRTSSIMKPTAQTGGHIVSVLVDPIQSHPIHSNPKQTETSPAVSCLSRYMRVPRGVAVGWFRGR